MTTDITAPYSQESEEATIGAVLVNAHVFDELVTFLSPDDFFIQRHAFIWEAFTHLWERNEPIDYLTAAERLRETGQLDEVGGYAYLTHMVSIVPTSIHAVMYGHLVERTSLRRKVLIYLDKARALTLNEDLTVEAITSQIEAEWETTVGNRGAETVTPALELMDDYLAEWCDRVDNGDPALGIPSGLREFDELTLGFHKSDFTIFAGEPGMGKTALMLVAALNALRLGQPVLFFSLEMGKAQITQRLLALETGISMQKLRVMKGFSPEESGLLMEAAGRLSKYPLYVDDRGELNPAELRATCNLYQRRHGIAMVFVDYLQLMNGGAKYEKSDNGAAELGYITRTAKETAKRLNVPIVAGSQLNRDSTNRKDKRPLLTDLRGSGSIGQDADLIVFIYRDVVKNPATEFPNQADIIIGKQRNGPTGMATAYFNKTAVRFENATIRQIDLNKDLSGKNARTLGYQEGRAD